jgi:hypothetical protein
MTAPDQIAKTMLKTLAGGARPHMIFAPLETHAYRIRLGLERCIAELYRSFKSLFAPDPLKLFRALFAR